jgi:N-acetyl-gamma-glutamylphosphate reductase
MSQRKIKVVVAGATGYVGLDLVHYLSRHQNVEISYLCAQKSLGKKISQFDERLKKKKIA